MENKTSKALLTNFGSKVKYGALRMANPRPVF